MRRNNVSLRLPAHLLERVKRLAEEESISVNQLVTVAVAEKIARLDAEAFYRAREQRSAPGAGWRGLDQMGQNSPPLPGDDLPQREPGGDRERRLATVASRQPRLRHALHAWALGSSLATRSLIFRMNAVRVVLAYYTRSGR